MVLLIGNITVEVRRGELSSTQYGDVGHSNHYKEVLRQRYSTLELATLSKDDSRGSTEKNEEKINPLLFRTSCSTLKLTLNTFK